MTDTWVRVERLDDELGLTATVEVPAADAVVVPREELENLLRLAGFRPTRGT